eukprot:m.166382 g.166382  ORF g.166382 m.166382 type:complete len:220 (-) comp16620_c0_seq5:445-1104(-)
MSTDKTKVRLLQPAPGSTVLLYPVMLPCSHCEQYVVFNRGEELPFGDISCGHKSHPTARRSTSPAKIGKAVSAPAAKRTSKSSLPTAAPAKKKSKPTTLHKFFKSQPRQTKNKKPAALPLTSTASPPATNKANSGISSGLLTPPLTPQPGFEPGTVVMVRVGKTDWTATVVAASKSGRQYQVRFDGVHKGHETWHDVDQIQALEAVSRRPRATTMQHAP